MHARKSALAAIAAGTTLGAVLLVSGAAPAAESARVRQELEDYLPEPMPPGFQVTYNELDGPVFADSAGRTLYVWPYRQMRRGEAGDQPGKSTCEAVKYTENGGFMEPYPGGYVLPDVEHRPTCADVWPAAGAAANAVPVGKWSIIARNDGAKQWAYGGLPVYTSVLDRAPGDTLGAPKGGRRSGGGRRPIGPASNVPPGFSVVQTITGRLLATDAGRSVYISAQDGPNKSNCNTACLKDWKPVAAPTLAQSRGEFTVFERTPGNKQWAFRGKPLYTYVDDPEGQGAGYLGSDEPGWDNAYTQRPLPLPDEFTLQDSGAGLVVADHRGMSIYVYNCTDDAQDQLDCSHPSQPQDYRLAICGGGDPDRCVKLFPYVLADKNAKSESRLWAVMTIDPKTGRSAGPEKPGTLHVWAYRDRPVYTFSGDKQPGDRIANGWGELAGSKNGFLSMIVRDDYFDNDR